MKAFLGVLALAPVATAVQLQGQPDGKDEPRFRMALFKFQRTGSSMFMEEMTKTLCKSAACRRFWKPEILTEVCGQGESCSPGLALKQIERVSNCKGTSCGWSLNLLRHGNMGLRIWDQMVEAMGKQPMTVIFLTRRNVAAQFVSYEIGNARREAMSRPEFFRIPGDKYNCNAFHFSSCNKDEQEWVNRHTRVKVNARKVKNSIEEHARNKNIYATLETQLRAKNISNLNIVHLEYEDLFNESSWRSVFTAAGLPDAPMPYMHERSDYSRFIENWDEVVGEAALAGYNLTSA